MKRWFCVLAVVAGLVVVAFDAGAVTVSSKQFADSSATAALADSATGAARAQTAVTVTDGAIDAAALALPYYCGIDSCSQLGDSALVVCTAVGDSSNTAIFVSGFQANFAGAANADMTFWVKEIWPGVSFKVLVADAAHLGHFEPVWFWWVVIRY